MMYERTFIIDDELFLANGICQNFSFDGGDGETNTPYQISNICQIQNISSDTITVGGVLYENLLDKSYKLTENIEASYTAAWNGGAGFYPIGDATDNFTGTFDGDSFTLSTLTIDRTTDNIGLFGYNTGTIKDIIVDSVDITGNDRVGGLVGLNDLGAINMSSSSGSVVGDDIVGGLVGLNLGGSINMSSSSGSVVGEDKVGGLVGSNNSGTIKNSSSSGSVSGNNDVGGFVGEYFDSENFGEIENSSSSGSVVGTGSNIGGFVGKYSGGIYEDDTWCTADAGSLSIVGSGETITGIAIKAPEHEDCQ